MSRLLRPLALRVPLSRAAAPITAPSMTPTVRYASSFLQTGPTPPRLPPNQQADGSSPAVEQPETMPLTTSRHVSVPGPSGGGAASAAAAAQVKTSSQEPQQGPAAGSFSGGIRQGAPPEFDGDKNPKTGEVGGPKNEPLRWGGQSDCSFNGRVTDF
ncbi:hypothetical protein C7999DRAFT_32096 [Corynascus novoguineensis]|uniref:Succinate dehydrogenase assembly factor 4, mitochondrial n=1 Tax=Corynascus novoguineensis TaxID=1126955 RepID=A0AAN7HNY0_9PEZI|nr:hypothetical protein C7999DRAFT_32096 [Corynascus novoguineensis]